MITEGTAAEQQKRLPNYLLDAAGISLDRMPMLNVIFDRMAATCTDSLQPMAGTPCFFGQQHQQRRVGVSSRTMRQNGAAVLCLRCQGSHHVDRDFVFTMVRRCSGRTAEPPIDVEPLNTSFVWCRRCSSALRRLCNRPAATSDVVFRLGGSDRDGVSGDRAKQQHVDMRQYHARHFIAEGKCSS